MQPEDEESDQAAGRRPDRARVPRGHSNWRATERLPDYLRRNGIVAIADIDTRRLTRILREKGAQGGAIMTGETVSEARAHRMRGPFPA